MVHDTLFTDTATEKWKEVYGYPNYRVSNFGRVQSRRHRNGLASAEWRDLKPVPDGQGYPQVRLYRPGDKPRWHFVSVLVLLHFVGPRPTPKHVARHFLSRDPNDNRAENLRWGTQADNCADKLAHGTDQSGERHWRALKRHQSPLDSGAERI